ncbi:hypothetical protein CMEL01_15542 [Colletotrichum melonis]|uniref:Nephrocystin 3-like N-terminal domain-containing protein n=1 Tax=Colletotrichum melonis TaxID=1209925 RepID=A0AAI9ULJ1_9PEZI|nr:hypothetical protein CMEL01_15542 [Colletotrichum melonis]
MTARRSSAHKQKTAAKFVRIFLRSLMAYDPKSRFPEYMQSSRLKGVKYQSDLRCLQFKLNSCQSQIGPQLTYITRNEKDNFSRLQEIKGSIESLQTISDVCSLRNSIKGDIQKLLLIPQRSLKHLAQRSILRALEFDTMYYCYDTICDAHEKTFRWILADDFDERCNVDCPNGRPSLATCEERRHIRQKLTRWLSSGSGVFHFSAKLVACKSTVMKIIINHGESRKRLDTWAGEKTLVCAKFFFWNSGSERQRSISGLYLGLLHEVLSAHPDLTPHDLPSFWETVYTSSWPAGERTHISPSQALQGLDRLFRGSDISQNYRFCLFIDGLDELHETTECSYSDLTEMIYRWSSLTSRLSSYD